MSCAAIGGRLGELAAGELDGDEAAALRAHVAACAACAAELAAHTRSLELCRRAGVEPLPESFTLDLRQALQRAGAPTPTLLERLRRTLTARPLAYASAVAIVAALLSAAATRAWLPPPTALHAAAYRVPTAKVALVKIDFVAAQPIDDVAFEITLPDGLRFVAAGELLAERSFRFQGRLAAGSNPIPIAVKGLRAGRYRLIAHAVGDELDVTQEVLLEVTT